MIRYAVLAAVSFLAGVLNAVAGGGSFFTFPALLGFHLPPVNANATNSVALWPGQFASVLALRRELGAARAFLMPSVVASLLGGSLGAFTLLHTSQQTFMRLVPWLLLFATVLFALSGLGRKLMKIDRPEPTAFTPALFCTLTLVTFYIGYFGAGAGFLVLTVFTMFGMRNLHEVNALKVLCASVGNGVAVILFILAGAVFWKEGSVMVLFAGVGGYLGGVWSRKLNQKLLRAVVIITGLTLSIHYFLATGK